MSRLRAQAEQTRLEDYFTPRVRTGFPLAQALRDTLINIKGAQGQEAERVRGDLRFASVTAFFPWEPARLTALWSLLGQ